MLVPEAEVTKVISGIDGLVVGDKLTYNPKTLTYDLYEQKDVVERGKTITLTTLIKCPKEWVEKTQIDAFKITQDAQEIPTPNPDEIKQQADRTDNLYLIMRPNKIPDPFFYPNDHLNNML